MPAGGRKLKEDALEALSVSSNRVLESPGKQGRGHLAGWRPLGLLARDLIQYRKGTSLFVLSMYAR